MRIQLSAKFIYQFLQDHLWECLFRSLVVSQRFQKSKFVKSSHAFKVVPTEKCLENFCFFKEMLKWGIVK